jgi:hypothetical protein
MNPNLRGLFIKKLTLERVVPTDFGNQQEPCQPFLAGVVELVHQIFLNPYVASEQVLCEQEEKPARRAAQLSRLAFHPQDRVLRQAAGNGPLPCWETTMSLILPFRI